MLRMLSAMFLFLCLCSSAWSAAHITDKLLAGIYPQPNVNGEPLKLLPSGTPVELKAEKDGFVNVVLVAGRYWGFSAHDGEQRKKHGGFRM